MNTRWLNLNSLGNTCVDGDGKPVESFGQDENRSLFRMLCCCLGTTSVN